MKNNNNYFKMYNILTEEKLPGKDLLLRGIGEKTRGKISNKLKEIPEGDSLNLDFEGIKSIDVSFADEGVVLLQKEVIEKKHGNRRIIVKNINRTVQENLEGAILRREEKYDQRIPLLYWADDTLNIIGKLGKSLKEIFSRIVEIKKITARQLAEENHIEINNASNKLKKLYDYGLIHRDEIINEEGKLHIYRIPD